MKAPSEEMVIEAGGAEKQYWRDLWRYRELFYFLAWRDILVRYKQTAVGVLWSIVRPLLTTVVFTMVFGRLASGEDDAALPSSRIPMPVFIFAAVLPWQLFSSALSDAGNSLVSNSNLISKVYFPRLVVPASAVITGFVDFLISAAFMAGFLAWYHVAPTWRLLTLPLFMALVLGSSIGIGVWMSALTVRYRDFRFIIPFAVQYGYFISPVGYSSAKIALKYSETARLLYSLNPMAGIIDGFRWCLLGTGELEPRCFAVSLAASLVVAATGVWYFRRTERSFADVI